MHHELVMDASMMMESMDITTLMAMKMEILPENVKSPIHLLALIYFPSRSKFERFFHFSFFLHPLILLNELFTMFLPPTSCFNPVTYPSTDKPYPPAILVKNPTWSLKDAVMSTPDALPTEIALIALLLSKFQVYLTSLCHYYHRPIILSTFQLLYQSTIHHMASINALRLPLKKFFCP
jgi:hypothetical protein